MSNNPYLIPWPFNDLDGVQSPPTALDLANVFAPLLAQCESLALTLMVGLEHGSPECCTPEHFAPAARLLHEALQLARQLYLAHAADPPRVPQRTG